MGQLASLGVARFYGGRIFGCGPTDTRRNGRAQYFETSRRPRGTVVTWMADFQFQRESRESMKLFAVAALQ
jgi:hypothetical protein